MSRLSTIKGDPGNRAFLVQRKAGLVPFVFVDGKQVDFVITSDTKRRLVLVFSRDEKGFGRINARRDRVHCSQIVGDVRIEWRRMKP